MPSTLLSHDTTLDAGTASEPTRKRRLGVDLWVGAAILVVLVAGRLVAVVL
jgi:hypothetical protein